MGETVKILEPMISAEKVYERWTGIHGHREDIASLINESISPDRQAGIPITYRVYKVLDTGNGEIMTICSDCTRNSFEKNVPYRCDISGDELIFDFTGIAFIKSQILEYEKTRPELFYKVIENPDDAWKESLLHKSTEALHQDLQTCSTEELKVHTSDMDTTIANLRAQIAELETELVTCREQLEEWQRVNPSGNREHGLCSLVIRMREEGKTDTEIAEYLYDNKSWCSISQVGALLYRGSRVTADAMLKHGQRLLGKA